MAKIVLCCSLLVLNLGCLAVAQPAATRANDRPVPSPSEFLGYPVGSRASTCEEVTAYTTALALTSERVTRSPYGQSHEGRVLFYLTITDPANHERLAKIQAENARLADPRQWTSSAEQDNLVKTTPAVAWLNYGIHGDELSSTDAALIVAYQLATAQDPNTQQLLRDTVIHIVPMVNPDGRERFLGQIRQFTGSVPNPDTQAMHHSALWTRGRGNHYLFDCNRDWLILEQPEIRDLAAVFKDWHPHLLVDAHEMGPDETYLFDPPNQPTNLHLAESTMRWRSAFGADQARAFDRYGWSYYTGDWYTDWAPIYTNAWASLRDAIGLLYEQARADSSQVKQPNGRIMTYHDTVEHHVVSTLANLRTLHANRIQILTDFAAARRAAVAPDAGPQVFLLPPHRDTNRWRRFVDLLQRQGLEVGLTQAEVTAHQVTDLWGSFENTETFPAGTAVVRVNQPLRHLLTTLLEFDPRLSDEFLQLERKELEKHHETRLYDTSAWNLPMAFALPAYWAQNIDAVSLSKSPTNTMHHPPLPPAQYGYLLDGQTWDTSHVLARMFDRDWRIRVATKAFRIGDRDYAPGALLLRRHENADSLPADLAELRDSLDLDVQPVDTALVQSGEDLGGPRFRLLTAPRTAICTGWPVSTSSFGSLWYLLDRRAGLACSPISLQSLGRLDLRGYNVLILPSSSGLERLVDEGLQNKLNQWVQDGGTLIAVGNSAAFLAQKDRGLSDVRLRRDVLEEIDVYDEAVTRERAARDIQVDPSHVWGTPPASDPNASKPDKKKAGGDKEAHQRQDAWQRIFSPSGVFLAGQVDNEHWLAAGLDETMPVYFQGSKILMSRPPVETVIRLAPASDLRLSGLLWPEARTRSADSAYVTVERRGRGQVILFAVDPSFRMWFPGLQRVFLNAVLLGPGMGTDPPRLW